MDTKDESPLFKSGERFTLEFSSPVPLYYQIEKVMLDRMADGNAVGRMLPSEKDLMAMFGVSRATVRKTYENLGAKRLIERRRALGTRVIGKGITEDLGRLKSFSEEMVLKGLSVSSERLATGQHVPDRRIGEKLGLGPEAQTVFISRLRGTSEIFPIVLLTSEIPVSYGIDVREDFSSSLYRLIEEKYRIPIEWGNEEIHASTASEDEARLLHIEPGASVLVMERVTYTSHDKPLEFVRGVYRPEHYTFSIKLRR